ncbi:hypothetical protein ACI0X9_003314 [Cronobacter turicensis]
MFAKTSDLYSGSEYHECLMSFIKKEKQSGNISLKKSRFSTLLKLTVVSISVFSFLIFGWFIVSFFHYGDFMTLLALGITGIVALTFLGLCTLLPRGQQSWFEYIEGEFDNDAMFRLLKHGAPEDVIDKVIIALSRTEKLSYSQLYDIFWVCCRSSDGSDMNSFLAERYKNVKSKVRAHYIKKGKAL